MIDKLKHRYHILPLIIIDYQHPTIIYYLYVSIILVLSIINDCHHISFIFRAEKPQASSSYSAATTCAASSPWRRIERCRSMPPRTLVRRRRPGGKPWNPWQPRDLTWDAFWIDVILIYIDKNGHFLWYSYWYHMKILRCVSSTM